MRILAIIFCFAALNVCAHEDDINAHQNDLKKVLTIKNIPESQIIDFCSDSPLKEEETSETDSISSKFTDSEQTGAVAKSLCYDSYSVYILNSQGYLYHVADYYDGTRIVTCLNGALKGLQSVYGNGIIVNESVAVTWHKKYFVHYYPYGNVYSYSNKQVIELF